MINQSNAGAASTQTVTVAASDNTTVNGVAGVLAIGGTAGVGAGVDVEKITKDTEAWIDAGAIVSANGDITVNANSNETVNSVSAGGSFAGTAAVTVNAAVSLFNITTKAYINGGATAGSGAVVNAGGSVVVSAAEQLTLNVVAGNLSAAGSAAVGAAAAVPVVTKTTDSYIGDNATVNATGGITGIAAPSGSLTLAMTDTRFDPSQAIEGNGMTLNLGYTDGFTEGEPVIYDNGGGASIGGLVDTNDPSHPLYYVHVISPHEIQLQSTQGGSSIHLTQPLSRGESHRIVPAEQAGVRSDHSPRFNPATDVTGNIISLPYSLSVSNNSPVVYSAGGGTPIGGLTDGATYYVIMAGGGIELTATKNGSPITLNKAKATGKSHSIVLQGNLPAANAAQTGMSTIAPGTVAGFKGVSVTATNSDNIAGVGVSAAISGSASVGVSGSVDVVKSNTAAYIGKSAQVNTAPGANSAQSVQVQASNIFHELVLSTSIAISGGAGVGAGVGVGLATLNTDAYIDNSATVDAQNNVVVAANGNDVVTSVVLAGGGGTVGVAGAVSVIELNTHTYANTGTGVTIQAGNTVLINAVDNTSLTVVAGGAAGGFVGVGVGVAVNMMTKDTEAFIGSGSTVNGQANGTGLTGIDDGNIVGQGFETLGSFNGVAVQAASSENLFDLALVLGGGFVGIAGGVGVDLMHITTKAFVNNNAQLNTAAGANSAQSVEVTAVDLAQSLTIGGGAAGGLVGVAGGIDIGVLQVTAQSYLGSGSIVDAANNVNVNALAIKNVQTYAISIGAGFVGAAGSVSVWSIGTQPTSNYTDGSMNRGNWSAGTDYKKGDIVTASDGKQYSAGSDLPHPSPNPANGANPSQWEASQNSLQTSGGNAGDSAGSQASGGGAATRASWAAPRVPRTTTPTTTSARSPLRIRAASAATPRHRISSPVRCPTTPNCRKVRPPRLAERSTPATASTSGPTKVSPITASPGPLPAGPLCRRLDPGGEH